MSNLTRIPLIDNYRTNLSQEWNWATGTVYVATTPTFTFPSWITTYIVVNPWKTNMQIAEINSYNSTNKTLNVSNITLEKWASVNSTAQTHTVWSEVIISDNYQFWLDILTAINSKIDTLTWQSAVYADATARNTAIPTPSNWMQVYITSEWKFYDYTAWSWTARESGWTFANASTTVAWKVEIWTQTEVDNGTDTWGTWAINVVIPSTFIQWIKNFFSTVKSSIIDTDKIWILDSVTWTFKGMLYSVLKTQLKTDLPVSSSNLWFSKMATNSLITTWTNEDTYINPKQLYETYNNIFYGATNTAYSSWNLWAIAWSYINWAYTTAKTLTASHWWRFTINVTWWVESGNSNQASLKLYLNWVLQEQKDWTYTTSWTYNLTFTNFIINKWDVLRLDVKVIQSEFPWNNEKVTVSSYTYKYDTIVNQTLFS